MENDKKLKKPFFAKFLESQLSEDETKTVNGSGPDAVTLKYPSDGEDGPGVPTNVLKDVHHTLKYPSDSDEDGVLI